LIHGNAKFKDPAILQQMLQDYISSGLSTEALARKYGGDHTSILFQVKKHKVQRGVPLQKPIREKPVAPPLPPKYERLVPKVHKYQHIFDEPINRGKASYAEYLAEYERRMRPIRREAMRRARETIKHPRSLYTSGRATSD
jgi:hypothetical protein